MNNIASVCTYVFCNNDNGEICTLVGKRTSTSPTGANLYTPPMGMVEQGENPYDATVRECFEETGIKLPKHKVVSYDTETYPMQGKQYTGANFYAFLDGTISNYPIGEGDGENEKFIWVPLSKIKTIPWAFGTGNKMREILNKLKIEMAKNTIRLTESELKKIISESVKRTLSERYDFSNGELSDISGSEDEDDYFDVTMGEYEDMDKKYKGNLDQFIQNNPSTKSWYDKLKKRGEENAAWSAKRRYDDDVNSFLNDKGDEFEDENYNYNLFDNSGVEAFDDKYWEPQDTYTESRKRNVRLTESKLKRVISESVRRVLSEMSCEEDLQLKQHNDLEAHADERYLYDTYTDADNEYRRQAWVNGDMPTDEYINYDGHSNFIRKDGREYGSLRKGAYGNLGRKQSKNAIHNAFKNTPYSTYQMYNKK
jgi:8-oxo-dGTP pyrophosphatase MutT (NUDIX family)